MIPLIGWAVCLYGACRLLTLPMFLPRREGGRIYTIPFLYVMFTGFLGVVGLAVIAYYLWLGVEAERKIADWSPPATL